MEGGVFVAHDATTAQEVQFTALRYVAKKLFIAQVTQFQCVKVILFLIRCITKVIFILIILNLYYIEDYTQKGKINA